MEALLKEAGHTEGRPTPAVMERVRALAAERGIVLEPRRSRRSRTPEAGAETTRTVYLPAGTPAIPRAQAVIARFGVTDGVNTEVLSGLDENASVIVSVIEAAEIAAAPAASPFGSPTRR
jgi:HlyD family secretion protein